MCMSQRNVTLDAYILPCRTSIRVTTPAAKEGILLRVAVHHRRKRTNAAMGVIRNRHTDTVCTITEVLDRSIPCARYYVFITRSTESPRDNQFRA